ncbi:MAG: DUF6468 domain-containing protein [Rhodospirillales bacterium]
MALSLALDILVAGLLAVTICYAMVLNRKISTLRRDKAELEKMATAFNAATTKAEQSIKKLKSTAGELSEQMDKARSLRDDLVFLTERGTSAADRLEDMVRTARDSEPGSAAPRKPANEPSDFGSSEFSVSEFPKRQAAGKNGSNQRTRASGSRTDAERALIRALQAVR